jgi:hypothetical protein
MLLLTFLCVATLGRNPHSHKSRRMLQSGEAESAETFACGREECEDGQDCVENQCVWTTPDRRNLQSGEAESAETFACGREECEDGQDCVNNECVWIPTRRRSRLL